MLPTASAWAWRAVRARRELFDLKSIGLQTGFLLASSLTCGMASLALKYNEGAARDRPWLVVTALLGAGFLGLEMRDFASMVSQGGTPMRSAWLSSLYALVGLHGLHITIGLIWIAVMLALIAVVGAERPRQDTAAAVRALLAFPRSVLDRHLLGGIPDGGGMSEERRERRNYLHGYGACRSC